MASDATSTSPAELYESTMTVPSDSEIYSANHEMSSSVPSTTSSPIILYTPPSVWGLLRGAAINLFLPFVNGLMLGFGELFAHEAAFRLGWSNTKIFPNHRRTHAVGPGIEMRELPSERRRSGLKDTASL
ncbi:Outer membrane protein MIM1/TOM13 mitochondrial [Penicillium paradoxum]|uniref:Outer membrane protein MIM1/TOM13 mitochondrial n=1 Tax=Penicillium paradoxum TaxID=176176 RepID=UPI00254817BC|nr:Outer membrane protein MIM1/TOM13 mitochondrial [Penicillium paradoxum]KAJ5794997.1 Outer membrane protein MIM1/TOM13 mitochondrial [Penicillium paradoxum]